jgi:hypothetical protein
MSWEAAAALAEILGATGVIASLLYLSRQVRQNTEATRLAMSHSITAAVRDWNRPLVEDADLMRVFYLGVEGSTELDEAEKARFSAAVLVVSTHVRGRPLSISTRGA